MTDRQAALNTLTRLLNEGDEADRCYSARALGNLRDPASIPALFVCLQDEDIDVCVDAADALGRIAETSGGDDAVPALLESLAKDPNGEIGLAVTRALGQIPDPRAVDALIAIARERPEHLEWDDSWDQWWDMQLAAVEALGRQQATAAIPVLRDILLADSDDEAGDIEEQVLRALARIGDQGLDTLFEQLRNGSDRVRRRAARALADAAGDTTVDAAALELGRALKDPNAAVRSAALGSLAKLGASQYLPVVLVLLRDPDHEVRATAATVATALAKDADGETLQAALLPLLDDPSSTVVRAALEVLNSAPETTVMAADIHSRALALLASDDPEIATPATTLLARCGQDDAAELLTGVLQDAARPARVRRQAALALAQIRFQARSRTGSQTGASPTPDDDELLTTQVLPALTQAIGDPEQAVRLAALSALMTLNERGIDDALARVLATLAGDLDPVDAALGAGEQVVEFQPQAFKKARQGTGTADDNDNASADTGADSNTDETPLPDVPAGNLGLDTPRAAQSTLEAIAGDNAEAMLLLGEELQDDTDALREDPEIKPFLDQLDANERVAGTLFPDREVSVELDVRRLSARILAGSDAPQTVTALLQALLDDDREVRNAAAFSLEAIAARSRDNPASVDADGARVDAGSARVDAGSALVNATGALVAHLSLGEGGQRAACARALAHLRNRAATGPLLEALVQAREDDAADLRIAAVGALADLVLHGADPDEAGHMVPVEEPVETVAAALLDALDDKDPAVRVAAADAVARLGRRGLISGDMNGSQTSAIERLIDTAWAGEGQQARAMGRALRAFGASQAQAPLLLRLDACKDSAERRFAIEMLDELLRPDGVRPV